MLRQMGRASLFNRWMADTIRPFMQGSVLEIGSGIGNLTEFLASGNSRYLATDSDPTRLAELRTRFPLIETRVCDAAEPADFATLRDRFDTVICLNVLEHIPDDHSALKNLLGAARAAGRIIILVPQGAAAFGSLDDVLGHQRRYSSTELRQKMTDAGFEVESIIPFNRATFPGWLLNSRILERRTLGGMQLRLFNALVPVWRAIDPYLPWPPTSLIAVGVKRR